MATSSFDTEIQKLYSEVVEVAYEYVNYNEKEVDSIYIYASMELGTSFFNVFYEINNRIVKVNKVNDISTMQYNISEQRTSALLEFGNDLLKRMRELFINDEREVPSRLKISFHPKTKVFENNISYEPYLTGDDMHTNMSGFNNWFDEMKNENVI